ncbi:MAG TPA: Hpt domain-containing protein [Candidatus Acidoferrum sp.]
MSEMSAIVLEFVEEGNEKADQLERYLIQLESSPSSQELLVEVFRALHTIKGATSFLGFTKLCALAHTGESLLARMRDGALLINQEIITALLSLVDAIREMLSDIAATGQEGKREYTVLIDTLNRVQRPA